MVPRPLRPRDSAGARRCPMTTAPVAPYPYGLCRRAAGRCRSAYDGAAPQRHNNTTTRPTRQPPPGRDVGPTRVRSNRPSGSRGIRVQRSMIWEDCALHETGLLKFCTNVGVRVGGPKPGGEVYCEIFTISSSKGGGHQPGTRRRDNLLTLHSHLVPHALLGLSDFMLYEQKEETTKFCELRDTGYGSPSIPCTR